MTEPLLEARRVAKKFVLTKGLMSQRSARTLTAVDDVSFSIGESETLGLVGESGCGKTTTAKLVLKLETPTTGNILFDGRDLESMSKNELGRYRAAVQAVFQDPQSSLNPRMRVGEIIGEPLAVNTHLPKAAIGDRVAEVLDWVDLDPVSVGLYPHEFSGGQRQRIAVARAVAIDARLIVLDEPVASLDASVRSQIINLFKRLQDRLGLSYLLISHDLAAARHLCHRVAVMYLGKIVELAPCDELFDEPLHPYTQALLAAALPAHPDAQTEDVELSGEVPSPIDPPSGCRFHPRCQFAMPHCGEVEPVFREVGNGRRVACHLYG
jgi:oligopeptide/dipeptide ABC transporter ATP-binding protein